MSVLTLNYKEFEFYEESFFGELNCEIQERRLGTLMEICLICENLRDISARRLGRFF
jgi:hypothetical protein